MSNPSVPAPHGQHKPDTIIITMLPCDVQAYGYAEMRLPIDDRIQFVCAADEGASPPSKPTPRAHEYDAACHAAAGDRRGLAVPGTPTFRREIRCVLLSRAVLRASSA